MKVSEGGVLSKLVWDLVVSLVFAQMLGDDGMRKVGYCDIGHYTP